MQKNSKDTTGGAAYPKQPAQQQPQPYPQPYPQPSAPPQPYPGQPGVYPQVPPQQGYPQQAPPPTGPPPPYTPTTQPQPQPQPQWQPQPKPQPRPQSLAQGSFDQGARFSPDKPVTVPPPPPGVAPTQAQIAAAQGQSVVMTQQKRDVWGGGSDAGYTFWVVIWCPNCKFPALFSEFKSLLEGSEDSVCPMCSSAISDQVTSERWVCHHLSLATTHQRIHDC